MVLGEDRHAAPAEEPGMRLRGTPSAAQFQHSNLPETNKTFPKQTNSLLKSFYLHTDSTNRPFAVKAELLSGHLRRGECTPGCHSAVVAEEPGPVRGNAVVAVAEPTRGKCHLRRNCDRNHSSREQQRTRSFKV